MTKNNEELNCVPPCTPLLQMQEDLSAMRNVLLGDRSSQESMRKSVFGTVERWGNWMDATSTIFRVAIKMTAVLVAVIGAAKAAGII